MSTEQEVSMDKDTLSMLFVSAAIVVYVIIHFTLWRMQNR